MTLPFLKDANGLPCFSKSDLRCSGDLGRMNSTKDTEKIKSFEASLTPAEKIVHDLAKKMLKTRYNPLQCNLFKKKSASLASSSKL